ncbi:LysR family transcriptional regulator [Mesorhizobium sp. GR13]|uniref:LysR family transcriptional regulator n=1 Tax=Mesorhizobium sp. GR13 TaxID=2562308 RepID=UPI0010C0C8B6
MTLPLDSDLLRTFLAVAESENFTKAGQAVARTQSAISMQMKRLERIVGEPVFERGQRGVQLTSVGERLLPNARRIISMLDDTTAMLNARLSTAEQNPATRRRKSRPLGGASGERREGVARPEFPACGVGDFGEGFSLPFGRGFGRDGSFRRSSRGC